MKECYAVTDINVIKLAQPGTFTDSLTEILRNGARALLAQAVETEVADFLGRYADLKTETGHQRVVRHGHLPEREIMTGIGPVAVRQPRVRAILEGAAARSQAAWADDRSAARRRRWGARILEGDRPGVAEDPRAALLGAQNRECLEQAAKEPTSKGQTRIAGHLDGGDQ